MTIGSIAETVEAALKYKSDQVEVHQEAHKVTIKAYVGKQLFTILCREEAKDDDAPAIS